MEEGLTYDEAQKLQLILEATEWEVKELNPAKEIHSIGKHSSKKVSAASHSHEMRYHCGGQCLHSECRFKHAEYHLCHKQGHIAPVCHQKAKRSHKTPSSMKKETHKVMETEENELQKYSMHTSTTDSKPVFVELKIKMLQFAWKLNWELHF